MQLEIPADLGITEEQARLDFAVGLYSSRTASLARAARLAGRSRIEFQRILADRGIPLAYDTEDLDEDIATLQRLDQGPDQGPDQG
jgi:predicted HTH domain antitoxin